MSIETELLFWVSILFVVLVGLWLAWTTCGPGEYAGGIERLMPTYTQEQILIKQLAAQQDYASWRALQDGSVDYHPNRMQFSIVPAGEYIVPMKRKTADPSCDYCGQSLYIEHCGAQPKKERPS